MRFVVLLVAALLLARPAQAADLATPTATAAAATPAATASPDASQRRDEQMSAVGGQSFEKPDIFEGGLQIGKTADGASLFTFAKRGTCTFNPPSLATDAFTVVSCTATGAAVGDFVIGQIRPWNVTDYTQIVIAGSRVTATDTVQFTLQNTGADTVDAGDLSIGYVVLR